jgi:hypothetical protein
MIQVEDTVHAYLSLIEILGTKKYPEQDHTASVRSSYMVGFIEGRLQKYCTAFPELHDQMMRDVKALAIKVANEKAK